MILEAVWPGLRPSRNPMDETRTMNFTYRGGATILCLDFIPLQKTRPS
ncbi:hypothetical protein [Azospirillum melinis]